MGSFPVTASDLFLALYELTFALLENDQDSLFFLAASVW